MEMQTQKTEKLKFLFLFLLVLILAACRQNSDVTQHSDLPDTSQELGESLRDSLLHHLVLLDLKEDLDPLALAMLKEDFAKLAILKGVLNFQLGYPADTGDGRLLKGYDISLSMYFRRIDDLFNYQTDSTHLSIRNKNASAFASPPTVIDQWMFSKIRN